MAQTGSAGRLRVETRAIEAAGCALSLAAGVKAPLRSLADQLIRSATSVPANIAEGRGRFGKDRIHHWRIAYGSAREVSVHVELLAAAGAIEAVDAGEVLALFDGVRAMLWRLMQSAS